jgi:hypothetical protein
MFVKVFKFRASISGFGVLPHQGFDRQSQMDRAVIPGNQSQSVSVSPRHSECRSREG